MKRTLALLLHLLCLLQPLEQTPQVCDAVGEGDLLVLVWPGVLQDLPNIDLWNVLLLVLPGQVPDTEVREGGGICQEMHLMAVLHLAAILVPSWL